MNKPSPYIMPDLGKVPPQAIDCESAVLGIILIYPDAISDVMSVLTPEMFYKPANQTIFKNCIEAFRVGGCVDLITVTERLRSNNELELVGGPVYITNLTTIVSDSHIVRYALIIKEKYLRRELIRFTSELQNISYDESNELADIVEYAESTLYHITDNTHTKEPIKLSKLLDGLLAKIDKIIRREIKLIGLPSGFTTLDRLKGGFMEGEFVIIAARPSIGKTALALQIAINNAAMGNAVAFFSCEMSGDSIAQRSLSGATGKSNLELIQGRCEIDDLVNKSSHLFMMPLFIDDTAGISITELHSKSRKLVQKNNVKMIIVDYIQLMKGEGDTREQVVAGISRGLKSIAKDLNLPVIGLSQLNREGEGKISLSKLRESGALEQDADVVLFLERPSKQGARTVIIDNNEVDASDKMLINIAKNRNGATGEIYIKHNDSLTWFSDLDDVDLTKCTF